MKENFSAALQTVFEQWGAFEAHPTDPDGTTNLGVTRLVWQRWTGADASEDDMRALTPELVAPMFKVVAWDAVSGDYLPAGLDVAIFDAAVQGGASFAVQLLQGVLGVEITRVVDSDTLLKAASADVRKLIAAYNAERLAYLQKIPFWEVSGKEWTKRVAAMQTVAESLVV